MSDRQVGMDSRGKFLQFVEYVRLRPFAGPLPYLNVTFDRSAISRIRMRQYHEAYLWSSGTDGNPAIIQKNVDELIIRAGDGHSWIVHADSNDVDWIELDLPWQSD